MKMLAVKSFFSISIIYYNFPQTSNRLIPIYQNSYLAARLGGIEQKKSSLAKIIFISQQLIIHFFNCFIPQASEPSMNFNISKMVY